MPVASSHPLSPLAGNAAPGENHIPGTQVLTVIEVAHELRCSKAHVLNLINGKVRSARPVPSLWLGRRRLVRRSSLDEWIKANEHGAMV
jgi:excisionase family DNA binding protein